MVVDKKNGKGTPVSTQAHVLPTLPEGYTAVNPHTVNDWFKPSEGLIVHGELLGRFTMSGDVNRRLDGSQRAYFQVKLFEPCPAIRALGDKKTEEIVLQRGDIINVDERKGLEELRKLTDSNDRFAVYIQTLEKINISGGRTFWKINVGSMLITGNTTMPAPTTRVEA